MPLRLSDLSRRLFRRTAKPALPHRSRLRLESLEAREVPSTVYENDFQSGLGSGWSFQTTPATFIKSTPSPDETGNPRKFFGDFGNNTVTLNLSGLAAHAALTISFGLYVIRTWDGNDSGGWGVDKWKLKAGDTESQAKAATTPALIDTTFANRDTANAGHTNATQKYGGQGAPNGNFPGFTGALMGTNGQRVGLGYNVYRAELGRTEDMSAVYRMTFTIPHTAATAAFAFSASGLQGLSDESWGLDNVKVTANKPLPEVSVFGMEDAVETGLVPGTFVFTRTGPTDDTLTVPYTVGGTAFPGVDYTPPSGSVTFLPGVDTVTVSVQPLADQDANEPPETVELTLGSGSGWTLGASTSDSIQILEDAVLVGIEATDDAATEEGDPGEVRVYRDGPTADDLVVTLEFGGTAENGADFQPIPTTVTIPAGYSEVFVPIIPIDDSQDEGTETTLISVVSGSGYRALPNAALAAVNITEMPDPLPAIRFVGFTGLFAQWDLAFSYNTTMKTIDVDGFNWIDRSGDQARFFIEVKDKAANTNPGVREEVEVTFSTAGPGTDYDEAGQTVKLKETGVNTGLFKSESLVLVASQEDDAYAPAGIADNGVGDRTFLATFGSVATAGYKTVSAISAAIKPRWTLNLNVQVIKDVAGAAGKPAVPLADVEGAIQAMQELYAPLRIQVIGTVGVIDPPTGYNPAADDLAVIQREEGTTIFLTDQTKAIARAGQTMNTRDVEVRVVPNLVGIVGGSKIAGIALTPWDASENDLGNVVMIDAAAAAALSTLAHEVGHLFELKHVPSEKKMVVDYTASDWLNSKTNIMAPFGDNPSFEGNRRFNATQTIKIQSNSNKNASLKKLSN